MIDSGALREALCRGIPVYVFLVAYLLTVVAANVLYVLPGGANLPALNIIGFSWSQFQTSFGAGFWLLLLLPVLMSPLVLVVRAAARPLAEGVAPIVLEFPRAVYLGLLVLLYGYAIYSLVAAHALDRFVAADEATAVVNNRFALLAALDLKAHIALKSLLVFLAIYGAVRAARDRSAFWYLVTAANVMVLTSCLILLNMKWPAVLFILTLGLCVLVVARKAPLAKTVVVLGLGVLFYLVISVVLLRWYPTDTDTAGAPTEQSLQIDASLVGHVTEGIGKSGGRLLYQVLNRMAIAVPYYYDFHNYSGPACQPEFRRLWHTGTAACEPTYRVYTQMFGNDGFAGRGTAPAASNIYGYAQSGWPGAIVATVIVMVVLGLFLALWGPAQTNAIFTAAFIMGGYTAYSFSQLPIAGPLLYDHGMIWWTLLVLFWIAISWPLSQLFKRRAGAGTAPS